MRLRWKIVGVVAVGCVAALVVRSWLYHRYKLQERVQLGPFVVRRYVRRMRALGFVLLVGCSRPSPAPAPPVVPVASTAPVASAAPVVDTAIPPLDLLERLAKEADAQPAGKLVLKPSPDPERDDSIHKRFGNHCKLERTCGPLWGIDCDAAVDGPYYYVHVRKDHLEQITTCGGACMGGRCTNWPPKKEGWTCATY